MEHSARPVASNGDYEGGSAANNDLDYKGQAALDLIQQAVDAVTATEKRLEVNLLKVLDQLKTAEDRNGILTARTIQAEGRASDAVKWLKRLHDEMEVRLAPRIELASLNVTALQRAAEAVDCHAQSTP
jgi:hypothetical protein